MAHLVGSVIEGRYKVVNTIGEGGMGAVYLGVQLATDLKVAIKVLHAEVVGPRLAARFRREAKVISKLRHPSTLKLIDFGTLPDGAQYLVTEYLKGTSLQSAIGEEPLDPLRALRILRAITLSLSEAHELGIVHRDLKPANIFLEWVGSEELVKVLDFGIAKEVHTAETGADELRTGEGQVIGTPAYIAPEQAMAGDVDSRTDLYSLGVVAYQCLSGRLPFTGDGIKMMHGHVYQTPPPLEIDPELERMVMSLLEKAPADRPASAAALRETIDQLLVAMESEGSADTVQRPPITHPKSKKGVWAALLVLVVGLGLAMFLLNGRIDRTEKEVTNGEPTPSPPPGYYPVPITSGED